MLAHDRGIMHERDPFASGPLLQEPPGASGGRATSIRAENSTRQGHLVVAPPREHQVSGHRTRVRSEQRLHTSLGMPKRAQDPERRGQRWPSRPTLARACVRARLESLLQPLCLVAASRRRRPKRRKGSTKAAASLVPPACEAAAAALPCAACAACAALPRRLERTCAAAWPSSSSRCRRPAAAAALRHAASS